ncbi:MAG: Holliday junction resolvase RuvX [Ignavibacteriaceae bacterium]
MNEENLTRILSIDFGLKRIGLALSDPLLIFASPYKTILNDNKLWKNLSQIIKEQNIVKIILGHPLKESGEVNYFHKQWEEFKNKLEKDYKLEVILWSETYTSSMAWEQVLQSVTKKKKRRDKGLIDMNSAAIMLREYLDKEKS